MNILDFFNLFSFFSTRDKWLKITEYLPRCFWLVVKLFFAIWIVESKILYFTKLPCMNKH